MNEPQNQTAAKNIVFPRFGRNRPSATPLALPPTRKFDEQAEAPVALDLTGKRKAWFLIGRGRMGKSFMARWVCEALDDRGAEAVVAAVDPAGRSLTLFRDNVAQPESTDGAEIAAWLRDLLGYVMLSGDKSAVIDFGGGSTALGDILVEVPDLATVLTDHNVAPIAVHVIGPDVQDLVPLAMTEQAGFQPAATLLVLNEVHGSRAAFSEVEDHPTMVAALARGAVKVWMPRLNPGVAAEMNRPGMSFADASRDGSNPFVAAGVKRWLAAMNTAFAPVASWIPD